MRTTLKIRLPAVPLLYLTTHNVPAITGRDISFYGVFYDANRTRSEWYQNLEDGDLPAINEANILSTFEQLHQSKADVFERGIINVFKGLSWDYKTNSPCFSARRSSSTIW